MINTITIKMIQNFLLEGFTNPVLVDDETSRRMWWSSLEIIQKQLLNLNYREGGLWVASPLPAINEKKILNTLKGWLWAPEGFPYFNSEEAKYLPHYHVKSSCDTTYQNTCNYKILNLHNNDGFEPFLMIITPQLQCILTIAGEKNKKILIMRSDEDTLKTVIELVDMKLNQDNKEESEIFQKHLKELGNVKINIQFANNFWPNLSVKLANSITNSHTQQSFTTFNNKNSQISEAKLLEAISHEVRTPLTTIRTLVSSTLKKYSMNDAIRNRLIQIDNECTEQIDRFGLIFNAAEIVSGESSSPQQLTSVDLGQMLKTLSPFWVSQLERRGIAMRINIPDNLPKVLSNSQKLELMLGGLIDKNTRGIREGSTLILELNPAGQQLKLELIVQKKDQRNVESNFNGSDLGPVLNWNPQTGSLQITQSATYKLLASLGGHVTKRRDTGLTVFFPIYESI